MTVIDWITQSGPFTTSSVSWDELAFRTTATTRDNVEYMLWFTCEYTTDNKNNIAQVRILLDGNEVAYDHFQPTSAGLYRAFSSMGLVNFDSGAHILSLEARSDSGSYIVTVRRVRLLIIQH